MTPRPSPRLPPLLALAGFLAACGPPSGKEGFAAYEAKDYKSAAELLLIPAREGNSEAQYRLAMMHLHDQIERGPGADLHVEEAVAWFSAAGSLGHVEAAKANEKYFALLTPMQKRWVSVRSAELIRIVYRNTEDREEQRKFIGWVCFGPFLLWFGYLVVKRIVDGNIPFFNSSVQIDTVPPNPDVEASPYVPRGFKDLPPGSISAAIGNAAQCEHIARYYQDAGKIREFIFNNRGQSAEFYGSFCRAFQKLGETRVALDLLDLKPAAEPGDEELRQVLSKALAPPPGANPQALQPPAREIELPPPPNSRDSSPTA